jgi:hypothetical protein
MAGALLAAGDETRSLQRDVALRAETTAITWDCDGSTPARH